VKQILQNLRSGALEIIDAPAPQVRPGQVLIETRRSLISAGTERSLVEFGKANLITKARQNPDRVQQVLDKIKADGLLPTIEAVFNRLDEPLPLGYCNAGVVLQAGAGVSHLAAGDRVASNGPHAEVVQVPVNLCAPVPDHVPNEAAAFAVLGAIGLQGIRLLAPQIGEHVVVFGLGLVGLLTVQMLVASGVHVIGVDLDGNRLELARSFGAHAVGAQDPAQLLQTIHALTGGHGVDGVLITASAKHDTIVSQSAAMCRQRGRIVLVGVVDLKLNRAEFYEKELAFQVSCSYGPGRYDTQYEQQGLDYPYGFVRWTEQRNIAAVLQMMSRGQLNVAPLITSQIAFADAADAYRMLTDDPSQLGIILKYDAGRADKLDRRMVLPSQSPAQATAAGTVRAGIIGAGGFTKAFLLPGLKKANAHLASIASAGGVSATHLARKFGIPSTTTDYREILADPEINAVFVTTRHQQHAPMAVAALQAGKHVFVEKPLAIDWQGLEDVRRAHEASDGLQLMVGYNRRFAPHTLKMRELLAGRQSPLCMVMEVNAGAVPPDHWIQDPQIGGGRLVGEVCHWIDLLTFLADAPVASWQVAGAGTAASLPIRDEHLTLTLHFADGSLGTVHYFANGHYAYPKESLRVYGQGRVLYMDNFRRLTAYGWPDFRQMRVWRKDRGHDQELASFVERVREGGPPLIAPDHLWQVTEITLRAREQLLGGTPESAADTDGNRNLTQASACLPGV
jgi:predicted dehydrogenase/threonine dehydrogenase-like Zn-dependent dehydrogenase